MFFSPKGDVFAHKECDGSAKRQRFEASDYAQTYSGHKLIASTWILLGEWDKFLAYTAEAEKQMGTDTLNSEYATSSSIFARNFKQRFALTPTEFKEPKGRKTSLEGYENDNINNPNPEC